MCGSTSVPRRPTQADAAALLAFLSGRGVLAPPPGWPPLAPPPPPPLEAGPEVGPDVVPLAGVQMVRAPSSGLLVWKAAPGARVRQGDCLADIVDPSEADLKSARRSVLSATSGLLVARRHDRLARTGDIIAKVAGATPLPGRSGMLLQD